MQQSRKDSLIALKKWADNSGILMPKLDAPVESDSGDIIVKCKNVINHNEAALMVPYNLTLSVNKTLANKQLKSIIMQHPEAFSEERVH